MVKVSTCITIAELKWSLGCGLIQVNFFQVLAAKFITHLDSPAISSFSDSKAGLWATH